MVKSTAPLIIINMLMSKKVQKKNTKKTQKNFDR